MKGRNILILDVDDDSTSLLSQLMARLDCTFRVEGDPTSALTHLRNETFTVVFAERSLLQPEHMMDIQSLHPDTCVIFTGHSLEQFKDHLNPGISDFLSKSPRHPLSIFS